MCAHAASMTTLEPVVVKARATVNICVIHREEFYQKKNQIHALGVAVRRWLDREEKGMFGPGAIWYLQWVLYPLSIMQ